MISNYQEISLKQNIILICGLSWKQCFLFLLGDFGHSTNNKPQKLWYNNSDDYKCNNYIDMHKHEKEFFLALINNNPAQEIN